MHECAHDLLGVAAFEHGEPFRFEPARRSGIEHRAAADRRLGPQHDPVAACCDDRLGQSELRVRTVARDPRGHRLRADVHRHGRRHVGDLFQSYVEAIGDGVVTGLDKHVATREVAAFDCWQVDRDALARFSLLDRRVVHLHAADAHRLAAWLDSQHVAG